MSQCACIKGDYDLHLETKDCRYIIYQDLSDWMDEDGYCDPTTYTLRIKGPKQDRFASFEIEVGEINKIDARDIRRDVSGKYLSDGVYCFEVENCGVKYTRNKAIICNLECCLEEYIIQENSQKDREAIEKIRIYIENIYANADLGNRDNVREDYKLAKRLITKANCDCKKRL